LATIWRHGQQTLGIDVLPSVPCALMTRWQSPAKHEKDRKLGSSTSGESRSHLYIRRAPCAKSFAPACATPLARTTLQHKTANGRRACRTVYQPQNVFARPVFELSAPEDTPFGSSRLRAGSRKSENGNCPHGNVTRSGRRSARQCRSFLVHGEQRSNRKHWSGR
jgi:hypothetical protein